MLSLRRHDSVLSLLFSVLSPQSSVLAILLLLASAAPAGSIKTSDGKTYEGRIKLELGKFFIEASTGPILRLNPADVVEATFDNAAPAQGNPDAGRGLLGQYFADVTFTRAAYTRIDPIIDFEWTRAPAGPGVPWQFAARWTGQILPAFSEDYTFTIASTNPVRLFIDDKPVIDEWGGKIKVPEVSGVVSLKAGKKVSIRLEFMRGNGVPVLKLFWASPSLPREMVPTEALFPAEAPVNGLRAEYFADKEFTKLVAAKIDPDIAFNWPNEEHGPDPRVGRPFSVRWTGRLTPDKPGNYFLFVRSVDPIKVYIDGKLVMDWAAPTAKNPAKHPDRSEAISLQAGHTYALRVETTVADKQPAMAMLLWSFNTPNNPVPIPTSAFQPPVEGTAGGERAGAWGPSVAIVSPLEDAALPPGKPVTIEAQIDPRGAPITKVEFFVGRRELGIATTRPYVAQWPNPPAGESMVTVVALDSTGMSNSASARVLGVTEVNAALPPPWVQAKVGYLKDPAKVAYADGVMTIDAGKGDIWNGADAMHLICTPLRQEGQVVVRVASLKPAAAGTYSVAGLVLRGSLQPNAISMAAVVTTDPAASAGIRQTESAPPVFTPKTAAAPCWLRLTRHGRLVSADFSPDGIKWVPLASQSLALGPIAYVGFFAATRDDGAQCTATFDHITLHIGPPPMMYSSKGILLNDGTFLPGEVRSADDTTLRFVRTGLTATGQAERSYPLADIARVIFHPLPREVADTLPPDKTGILLNTGDFLEADIQSIDIAQVKTNSVVFGLGVYSIANQAAAVLFHDATPPVGGCQIRLSDGAILHCADFTIEKDHLQADTGPAGRIDVPASALVEIRRGS